VVPLYPVLNLWTFGKALAAFYERFGFVQEEVIPEHGRHKGIVRMVRSTNHKGILPGRFANIRVPESIRCNVV
jgi:hypothetical protein